jgi:hypothetical protein
MCKTTTSMVFANVRIRHGQQQRDNMPSNYGIQACSYVEAVRQIASNHSEKTFAYVSLMKPYPNDQEFALERAFASNTTLKELHVTTNGCGCSVVMELCRGLRTNKSIETVLWIMAPSDRTVVHANAIHDWVKSILAPLDLPTEHTSRRSKVRSLEHRATTRLLKQCSKASHATRAFASFDSKATLHYRMIRRELFTMPLTRTNRLWTYSSSFMNVTIGWHC